MCGGRMLSMIGRCGPRRNWVRVAPRSDPGHAEVPRRDRPQDLGAAFHRRGLQGKFLGGRRSNVVQIPALAACGMLAGGSYT